MERPDQAQFAASLGQVFRCHGVRAQTQVRGSQAPANSTRRSRRRGQRPHARLFRPGLLGQRRSQRRRSRRLALMASCFGPVRAALIAACCLAAVACGGGGGGGGGSTPPPPPPPTNNVVSVIVDEGPSNQS